MQLKHSTKSKSELGKLKPKLPAGLLQRPSVDPRLTKELPECFLAKDLSLKVVSKFLRIAFRVRLASNCQQFGNKVTASDRLG